MRKALKTCAKALATVVAVAFVYLAIAMSWAACEMDSLIPPGPTSTLQPVLTARQAGMLLKIEDPTFYRHAGVDLSDGQGVATITTALAGAMLIHGRPLAGPPGWMQRFYAGVNDCCKAVDIGRDAMAVVLNRKVPKDRQLALYEHTVYLGTYGGVPVHGFDAAARTIPGLASDAMTDDQALELVARIKAPDYFRPDLHPAEFATRLARVKAVVSGRCHPDGWFDTSYDKCTPS